MAKAKAESKLTTTTHGPVHTLKGKLNEDYLECKISPPGKLIPKEGVKHVCTVGFVIPKNDKEAQDRYNTTLNELVKKGVRNGIGTGPNWQDLTIWNADGSLKEGAQAALQTLADGYKVGNRQPGKSAEQKELSAAAEDAGLSHEDMMDMIAKAKAAQKK